MASISKNIYGEIVIEGPLIPDDIVFLNRIETDANICFKNTKYLSSDLLKQVKNKRLTFSIIGGLERRKRKYDNDYYQARTYHTVEELIKIIEYFEDIEKGITPEMNQMQKCMYIYCCLIQDTNYVTSYRDADIDSKLIENTLTGNLYHKLTCAGIALTFKELLDRQGIECEYLNKINQHSFNRVTIDGKKYGMDLTWDLNRYEHEGNIFFTYFGRQDTASFYQNHHDLRYEEYETMDEVATFTQEEIDYCYNSIKHLLDNREKHTPAISQLTKEEKIATLTILHIYSELQIEASYIELIKYLKRNKLIAENDFRIEFAQHRYPIVGDIVGNNISGLENVEGIDPYYYFRKNHSEDFVEVAKKAIDQYLESYIREFFDMSYIYARTFKYVPLEENEELYISYYNVKNKIEYFATIRDIVIKMGYGEELNYFLGKLKEEEEKVKAEKLEKEDVKSQYDYDYDFLAGCLSPSEMLDIKDYIEIQIGREISIEEFKQHFTNPSYMRTIFIKEWNFTDAELQRLLNEVYEENISLMIEFMNKRIKTPMSQTTAEEPVQPAPAEGLNDIPDDFYWNPSIEDESFKNMPFF